ncbi:uncharacterized protein SCHCODRAFT_02603886 [Schizophyllum commune H4-8]|uniref:uncharacterized protein n=1 Tax=Schizophyllum commune (strain H4-8 / FGSC 9210) TaxID=578458 RepID=UPI0021609670|nr:uncharacterized protein SCHCODRAFT_02603886 [Schizophyllum commune H4-8]KAI5898983.1 hypothetical protein SCHCODRAFT_02603886 [Schizophyllum commune H4-8]
MNRRWIRAECGDDFARKGLPAKGAAGSHRSRMMACAAQRSHLPTVSLAGRVATNWTYIIRAASSISQCNV